MELSDQELIVLLKQGNELAMTGIYHRYWRRLIAIAYMHTKDKSTAKEIVQDIMVKLWERRNKLDIENLNNYLGVAVRYAVYHQYLKDKNRNRILGTLFLGEQVDKNDEVIYAQFLKQQIDDCVGTLPEKCRLVFKFSREQGKSITQIANEMSIAEKTVEAHLSKALKAVRLSLRSTGWLLLTMVYLFS